jgi:hypothetical protein
MTTMSDYEQFLRSKAITTVQAGFEVDADLLHPAFDGKWAFQDAVVRYLLKLGRGAAFEDCGLGKTPQQLVWGEHVCRYTDAPGLIVAPLAVSEQTRRDAWDMFGIPVTICESKADVRAGLNITNYEKLHRFDASVFLSVVLDESSILKAYDGKTRQLITEMFCNTPYRLCCTATPAPNDHMELGTHAEFLGIMTRSAMLSEFFVHDGGDTSKWRLKGHVEDLFWAWVASWAVVLREPADLGYSNEGFERPPLIIHEHVMPGVASADTLFPVEAQSLNDRRGARRASLSARVEHTASLVDEKDSWLLWCDLNAESEALTAAIHGAIEVTGSQSNEVKAKSLLAFSSGDHRVIVTKPTIAGFGMNWQHCHNMAFVGLSDSWEQYYQAVRRCWRYGQNRPVNVHIVTSENEGAVVANIKRKEAEAEAMYQGMIEHTRKYVQENVSGVSHAQLDYREESAKGTDWTVHMGDCVEVARRLPCGSAGYSIFSPPFASLYTYSNSDRDMGNSRSYDEFFEHMTFLAKEQYRVLAPGRLLSFHCMNLPTSKERDGYIGIRDFRGALIRMYIDCGFIFHSEVCIWKDPVTAMQRTKAIGLLYKQLRKDSALSRQGIPDYLVTMRKPDVNESPITKTHESFPVSLWQNYASPVWMDINPSDTLQKESAREDKDERHICPLQKEVIRRGIQLWSNPGDVVLSPFAGIGSEGFVALQECRKFVGIELKESYWKQACANLRIAEQTANAPTLFDEVEA